MFSFKRMELVNKSKEKFRHSETDLAGDMGEKKVLDVVEKTFGNTGGKSFIFPSIRVPRGNSGKYEVDILVASEQGILAIEVKNWGGEITLDDRGMIKQISAEKTYYHYHPVQSLNLKMEALNSYFKKNNILIPKKYQYSYVVLANENVKLSQELKDCKSIIFLSELNSFITRVFKHKDRTVIKKIMESLKLRTPQKRPVQHLDKVKRGLDCLPTWDEISLFGGRKIRGDIHHSSIELLDGNSVGRLITDKLNFKIPRTRFSCLLFLPKISWKTSTGERKKQAFKLGQKIKIRLAGRAEDEEVDLIHIEDISFGWENHSYYDGPKPDLSAYKKGKVFNGFVSNIVEYGIFVKLDKHRNGLVHISKLKEKNTSLQDFEIGANAKVLIIDVEVKEGKERISLDIVL